MKLNVQHLQRTKGDGEDYEKLIQRITDTLIEQIDNLSNIATEFSSFAQIPTALPQIFKLSEQIEKVIDLYEPGGQDCMSNFMPTGWNILMKVDVTSFRGQSSIW